MSPLSSEQAQTVGRLGGLAKAARNDAREGTRAAREGFLARFEREVDPDGVLEPEERLRRATAAKKLHMARLLMKQRRFRAAREETVA